MFEAVHALAGAAVGSVTGSPADAFLAGFVSHAVLDAVPHWDYGTVRAAAVDVAVTAAALAAVAVRADEPALLLAGAAGAVLPDLEVALNALGRWPWRRLLYLSHSGLTPHLGAPLPWGVVTQLVVTAAAVLVLF